MKIKTTASHNTNRRTGNSNTVQPSTPKINIVVPYHQGLSESIKRTCKKYGIQVNCKRGHIIKNLLMVPKDKDHILNKSGVIYRYSVTGFNVMKNTLGSQQEPLQRGLKNN